MRPSEIERMEKMREALAPYDPIKQRMAVIAESVMNFCEWLWTEDPDRRAAWREYREKHPKEYAARERSAWFFMNKALPSKIQHESNGPSRRIKAEDLEAMKLTPTQLKAMAGLIEVKAEEVVEEEPAQILRARRGGRKAKGGTDAPRLQQEQGSCEQEYQSRNGSGQASEASRGDSSLSAASGEAEAETKE